MIHHSLASEMGGTLSNETKPTPSPELCEKLFISSAQEKLGIDVENQYNFAVCGCDGTGLFIIISMFIFSFS